MTVCIERDAHVCTESVGKEGGEEKERVGERELYLDHGLTVDFNNFVQPLQSKRQK